jgi:hypothetical protein
MKYESWRRGYAVGFRYRQPDGSYYYAYLNPSSDDSDGVPNVFLYAGTHGDPALDSPLIHVPMRRRGNL